jgi:hypothetical protein
MALPPPRFYQLLDWYSRNNFKRFRALLGIAQPRMPPGFFQRRPVSERDVWLDDRGPRTIVLTMWELL